MVREITETFLGRSNLRPGSTGMRREDVSTSFTRLLDGSAFTFFAYRMTHTKLSIHTQTRAAILSSHPENMGSSAMVWEIPTVYTLKGATAKLIRQANPDMAIPTSESYPRERARDTIMGTKGMMCSLHPRIPPKMKNTIITIAMITWLLILSEAFKTLLIAAPTVLVLL